LAHSRPKHAEKRNILKNGAPSWLYLQDCTGMHGQQNIKYRLVLFSSTSYAMIKPPLIISKLWMVEFSQR
jgi:hypothetical protein